MLENTEIDNSRSEKTAFKWVDELTDVKDF